MNPSRILPLLLIAAPALSAAEAPLALQSLCTSGEQVSFSCKLQRSEKMLSVCASAELTDKRGHVQYRYGRPGNIELVFPATREKTQGQFQLSTYTRSRVSYQSLSFSNGGYRYEVFSDYNAEDGEEQFSEGVRVTDAKGAETLRACAKRASGNLMVLEGRVPAAPQEP